MERYVSKVPERVTARPCTRAEADAEIMKMPVAQAEMEYMITHRENPKGYLVKHPGGYLTFMTESDFEEHYQPVE